MIPRYIEDTENQLAIKPIKHKIKKSSGLLGLFFIDLYIRDLIYPNTSGWK